MLKSHQYTGIERSNKANFRPYLHDFNATASSQFTALCCRCLRLPSTLTQYVSTSQQYRYAYGISKTRLVFVDLQTTEGWVETEKQTGARFSRAQERSAPAEPMASVATADWKSAEKRKLCRLLSKHHRRQL